MNEVKTDEDVWTDTNHDKLESKQNILNTKEMYQDPDEENK